MTDVLRVQIATSPERFRCFRRIEIGLCQPGRAHHEFAGGFTVMHHIPHFRIDDTQVDQGQGQAGLAAQIQLFFRRGLQVRLGQMGDAQHRTGFRHAIADKGVNPAFKRRTGQCGRQCRTAHHHLPATQIGFFTVRMRKQHLHDRRNAVRESHLLFAQQAQQGGRQIAAGIDLTDSQQRGHIREAPGVDVEHGGDRHIDVITMHPSLGKRATDMRCKTQRVQHQLAMAEANSLGLPGRPGGIEHSRLGVFVEIREVEIRGGRCKQRLVFGSKRHRRIKQRRSLIVDQDVMTDSFQAWRDLRDQREKLAVEQQHVGLGMNQGKGDLFGAQAHIHRLQDRPHHRDGEKAFQIAMAIPVHHRHGLPGFHAQAGQAAGQATDPLA